MANILIVYYYAQYPPRATHVDHLYALKRYSGHRVSHLNMRVHDLSRKVAEFPWDIIMFDDLFFSTRWQRGLFAELVEKVRPLQEHPAVKAIAPQDEFLSMDVVNQFVRDFDVAHIFSVSPASEWPKIYPKVPPSAQIHKMLTGYIDNRLQRRIGSFAGPRTIDIGYRTHRSPYWLGRHAQLKSELGVAFARAFKGLTVDISVEKADAIKGDGWFKFLSKCKYQLGIEGGASILDWDGSYQSRTAEYLKSHRGASFEEVESVCFPGVDGSLQLYALSPRHFECALTRTCQILVEGEYDGVLKPWQHYIPVKKDLSNVGEVLGLVRDDKLRRDIVERTWDEIVAPGQYTYEKLSRQMVDMMLTCGTASQFPPVSLEIKERFSWVAINLMNKQKTTTVSARRVRGYQKKVRQFLGRVRRKVAPPKVLSLPVDRNIHWVDPLLITRCANNGAEFPLAQEGAVIGGDWDQNEFPFSSLDTYKAILAREQGIPWQKTAYYDRVMKWMARGEVMWSCRTAEEFDQRCAKWDELLEDIKQNGYRLNGRKPQDEIAVNIGRTGHLLFNNGRHRLAMAQIIGLPQVPIRITARHPQWVAFKQEILQYAATHNKQVYAPLLHPDLEDIPYLHTHERYEIMANAMDPHAKTLLDIGAHWGYFDIRFAREEMDCTAVEYGARNSKIMAGMMEATDTRFTILNTDIFTVQPLKYDAILALSIFHHFLLKQEKFQNFMGLLQRLDCREMFVEMHNPKENQMQDAYMKLEPSELADLIVRKSNLTHYKRIGETEDRSGTVRGIYKFWR